MNKDKYDLFFKHRENLIFMYKQGDLTKEEFIEENYYYIQSMNVKPFRKIDNMNKGIFNYQYYNVIAKHYQKKAHSISNYKLKKDFFEKTNYFYQKKDTTTLKVLELINFENIYSYYVKVHSKHLKNKLIEIVFKDYDNLIFHTISPLIHKRLVEEGVFINQTKRSLIEEYINKKF